MQGLGIAMALRRPYKGDENGLPPTVIPASEPESRGGDLDARLRGHDEERRCKAIFMVMTCEGSE